jgi:hypothetical protein
MYTRYKMNINIPSMTPRGRTLPHKLQLNISSNSPEYVKGTLDDAKYSNPYNTLIPINARAACQRPKKRSSRETPNMIAIG